MAIFILYQSLKLLALVNPQLKKGYPHHFKGQKVNPSNNKAQTHSMFSCNISGAVITGLSIRKMEPEVIHNK